MTEIVNCSRCRSKELTQADFGLSKTGDRMRTCNACRLDSKQRKDNNREEINKQAREHYQTVKESKIECVTQYRIDNHDKLHEMHKCDCGGKFIYRNKARLKDVVYYSHNSSDYIFNFLHLFKF
jgi:hypothetical protein